jgi:prepilin-type N-terminal cleavage/methylation domain-containing protein
MYHFKEGRPSHLNSYIFFTKAQKGFTLIELVMTIVLLGILSATALPRFADLTDEADESVFKSVHANFKVGINLVHSTSLIRRTLGTYPDISLEGNCIMVDPASGYPEVDQTTGTCTPVALNYPLRFYQLSPPLIDQAIAFVKHSTLPIASAYAAPPPPPPPPPGTTELPSLLMYNDFIDWIWNKTVPTATLTSPEGSSFEYNQNTGVSN